MEQIIRKGNMHEKQKMGYIGISVFFTTLLLLTVFSIPVWNFIQNPYNRHRSDSATSTAHTILIDEHYRVSTTSASKSILSYTPNPQAVSTDRKIISQAVDRLNWNDDYIIASAKGSNKNESFVIIKRSTVETTGYSNKREFQKGKKEKGIKLSLKNKTAFDWY